MDQLPKIQSILSFSASACNESLVNTVPNDKLTASSEYSRYYTASKARLSSTGWGANSKYFDSEPWIQVTIFLYIFLYYYISVCACVRACLRVYEDAHVCVRV